MTKKKILLIGGVELAVDEVQYCSFNSDFSLLDWDIILFKPTIWQFDSYSSTTYQGKPSLSESASFELKGSSEHWRREIKDAVESGKTVIVFLPELEEIFIDSGQRQYSGTGRNQKKTILVEGYDNYRCIPANLSPVSSKGTLMKLTMPKGQVIAPLWKEFEKYFNYKVVLQGDNIPACIVTKTGDKPVGAIYLNKNSSGALILVPDIDFYPEHFSEEKDDEAVWTKEAFQFASSLLKAVVALDEAIKKEGNLTPEPTWAKEPSFQLIKEKEIAAKLLLAEEKVEELQRTKEDLLDHLKSAGRLRNLLYEKGRPLEYAILDALDVLGFQAKPYKDQESEFDVVFEAPEGRFLGEVEGKDNKAINIEKLRQLEMNINEDLQRDEVDEPAKAVLFGNAFRLTTPGERENPFTQKCHSAAARSSTALVSTPDLFTVAQYLADNRDSRFAAKCRQAIITTVGRVTFPEIPAKVKKKPTKVAKKKS